MACREDSIMLSSSITCVPQCEGGKYLERSPNTASDYECAVCDDQCVNCTGAGNMNCVQCLNANYTVEGITTCLQTCPANTFKSESGLCQNCHPQCFGGCSGPFNTECSSCLEVTVQVEGGGVECAPFCPFGREYSSESDNCELTL